MNTERHIDTPMYREEMGRVWLVTGAGGFLGSNLVKTLVARGEQVRAGLRSSFTPDSLAGVDCERVHLDVTNPDTIRSALRAGGPDQARRTIVVHAAGVVSIADRVNQALWRTNVLGTQNIVDACRAAQVARLVYISSVHAIPEPAAGEILSETDQFDPELVEGAYAKTKAEATRRVLTATSLDRVVVQPTGIMGPGDHGDGAVTRLIRDLAANRLPVLVEGGYDFVDVRDVTDGTIVAAERAPSGRCYLLGAERASLLEIAQTLHEAIGSRVPLVIPAGLAGAVVPFAVAWSKLRGSRPIFTKYSLDVVRNYTQVSHARAAAELDFAPRPLRQTILDTANFVQRPAAH